MHVDSPLRENCAARDEVLLKMLYIPVHKNASGGLQEVYKEDRTVFIEIYSSLVCLFLTDYAFTELPVFEQFVRIHFDCAQWSKSTIISDMVCREVVNIYI